MRLYPLTDTGLVSDAGIVYKPAKDGGFDLPEELAELLRSSAVGGVKQWETDTERQRRIVLEEMERRKDPATLLAAVEQIVAAAQAVSAAQADAPAKTAPKTAAASK